MRTRLPAPVIWPGITVTPGARAVSRSPMLETGAERASSETSTVETALPISRFDCSPVAVTMNSSSE